MIMFIRAFLRFVFEIALLVTMLIAGIRALSGLAIILIVFRLSASFSSRIYQIPYLCNLDRSDMILLGVYICVLKIVLDTGIFFSVKEGLNISMGSAIAILIFMSLRNISDTLPLLAIESDDW